MIPQDIILDASVIARWFVTNKTDSDQLRQACLFVYDNYKNNTVTLHEPTLLLYELGNVINSISIITKQSTYQDTILALNDLEFVTYDPDNFLSEIYHIAQIFQLSFYDASYVFIAKYMNKYPFYTADKKLLQKVGTIKNIFDIETLIVKVG